MNANEHFNAAVQERDAEIARIREENERLRRELNEQRLSDLRDNVRYRRIEEAARELAETNPNLPLERLRAALADQPTEDRIRTHFYGDGHDHGDQPTEEKA